MERLLGNLRRQWYDILSSVLFSKECAPHRKTMLHELEPRLPEIAPLLICMVWFLIALIFLPGERAASRAKKEQREAEHRRTAA
jgi:hypothetical protein